MIGARKGRYGPIHRLIARATATHLQAFTIPGLDVARATGQDLEAAGLTPVETPRRANVLVLLAPVPDALIDAAVIAYAQMPRPRAILCIGEAGIPDLPEPDIRVSTDESDLATGVERLRHLFETSAWNSEVSPFQHDSPTQADEAEGASMSHHHHHGADDEHQAHDEHAHANYDSESVDEHVRHGAHPDHEDHAEQGPDNEHAGHEEHAGDQSDGDHESHEHSDHGEHQNHGGHDMDHGHHGDGFMSMIAMTQHLPRSPDGLQMDWLEVPFGPVHSGLPSGLNLTLTLDGDRIATAQVNPGVSQAHLGSTTPAPVDCFPVRLALLDRLAPDVYRILAEEALVAYGQIGSDKAQRIIALERARVQSHLNWLVSLADLLGFRWLSEKAETLLRCDVDELELDALHSVERACRSYLMRRRLQGIGRIERDAHAAVSGPVARAMGLMVDARCHDPAYLALGFEQVTHEDGDALARLLVRLDEIRQSLDLIRAARSMQSEQDFFRESRDGNVEIETPRGRATMHLTVENGQVTQLHLDSASTRHLPLIPAVSEGLELGAGLIAIASLDISPWEVDP